jgi:outer membrane protein assembly factor BamA
MMTSTIRAGAFLGVPVDRVPIAPRSNVRLGPALKYVSTDLSANTFIAQDHPYGTDGFGQVGLQGSVIHDTRDSPRFATRGVLLTAGSSFYPGIWSAEEAFGEVDGSAATYITPTPDFTVGLRQSGKYVWGIPGARGRVPGWLQDGAGLLEAALRR